MDTLVRNLFAGPERFVVLTNLSPLESSPKYGWALGKRSPRRWHLNTSSMAAASPWSVRSIGSSPSSLQGSLWIEGSSAATTSGTRLYHGLKQQGRSPGFRFTLIFQC
ncbi:uncharacterized protein VTP21DRAFT_5415 [Calcarisporiella thermophila]|uniref:uncharacterized protein n=1 Tax=Calcarisporiella thermophila TaxID=911321 RepID=UPI00374207C3